MENSYQKLQNEETLSTISFHPPLPQPKKVSFWKGLLKFTICFTLLLIIGNILCMYAIQYFRNQNADSPFWDRFYQVDFAPKHVISKQSCPLLSVEYDSQDYEDSVGIRMHRILTRGKVPEGYNKSIAFKMVKDAYESCRTGMEDLKPVTEMVESVRKVILKDKSRKSIAETVALLQSSFGLETFFKFEVLANFQDPDGDQPYFIYLSPNQELIKIPDEDFEKRKVLGLRGMKMPYIGTKFGLELQELISDSYSENSSYWKVVELKTFDPKEYTFDFKTYFKTLLKDSSTLDLDTMKFVIKDPDYIVDLDELISRTEREALQSFFLTSLWESTLDDFDNCMHAIEKYVPHAATIAYLSTFKEGEIESVRERFLEKFELLAEEIEGIATKYLNNDEQRKLAKERIHKIGLTTEEPDWLQLDDSPFRFEQEHKDLQVHENSPALVALLRLRRFAFLKSISHLKDKTEALRNSAFENTPMSKTKMEYSRVGNWINVPVASFMDIDEEKITIQISQQIAKVLDSEGFKWSPFGTQRSENSYSSEKYVPKAVLGQEQCFRVHGLSEEEFSLAVGLEAAYKVLLKESKHPFGVKNLPLDLASKVAADGSFQKMTIASGFLEHIGAYDRCPQGQHLPCFLP